MIQLTDERAIQAVKAALRWMKTHNVVWLKTEEKIYSRKYDFAGTTDGLAYVDSCDDPACCTENYKHRMCLVDWKTTNHLSTINCFQTAAYQQALQEEHNSPIESRWVLRLGKSEEEAGKFEPWFLSNDDFKTDLEAFLACLTLTRLVDSVEERMKYQKGTIRAVKKEQRETAKVIAKEKEKMQKALDKAAAKIAREEEKKRIKEEAKVKREELKAAKKAGIKPGSVRYKPSTNEEWIVTQPGEPLFSTAMFAATQVLMETGWEPIEGPQPLPAEDVPEGIQKEEACTSTSQELTSTSGETTAEIPQGLPLASTSQTETSTSSPRTSVQETPQPVATILTVEAEPQVASPLKSPTEDTVSVQPIYEEEIAAPTFKLPME